MTSQIQIGTCGFGRTKKPSYVEQLNCVEIQHTFYNPPQVKTLEKWRCEMPENFEFTLKAWQFITHEAGTPTYRRLKRELSEKEAREVGAFKSTESVDYGWQVTLESAKALSARTILFQCPAKFVQSDTNIKNMRTFFKRIDRDNLNFAWEPRGKTWDDTTILKLCLDLDLWHCVDPFVRRTLTPDRCYYRLHGIGGYRYTYEEGELEELVSLLPEDDLSYVFFNNNVMFDDAVRFRRIAKESLDPTITGSQIYSPVHGQSG
jgi:uncharacterized protein YecE (DUF72 family)